MSFSFSENDIKQHALKKGCPVKDAQLLAVQSILSKKDTIAGQGSLEVKTPPLIEGESAPKPPHSIEGEVRVKTPPLNEADA